MEWQEKFQHATCVYHEIEPKNINTSQLKFVSPCGSYKKSNFKAIVYGSLK